MLDREAALVTGSRRTATTLQQQLAEYIPYVNDIKIYVMDEGVNSVIGGDLIIVSSDVLYNELMDLGFLDQDKDIVIAQRTINFDQLDQVVGLERGSVCLLVNDLHETAKEIVDDLEKVGLNHIDYFPYGPDQDLNVVYSNVKIAITPGESNSVPNWIERIIDIGPRIFDFSTLALILSKLNLLDERAGMFSQKYLEKIINVAFRLSESRNQVNQLNDHLETVLECLNDGLLVYKLDGVITVSNENFKRLAASKTKVHVGKRLTEVIADRQFLKMLQDENEYDSVIFSLQGRELLMTKMHMFQASVVVTLKSAQDTLKENDRIRRELLQKGFIAKYSTVDLIGHSKEMEKVKNIIHKLAKTQLTILITGESGTGKELIASAIHNASDRQNGPFLAVNFSALSDELIESELFGYEEGSFTGAKKGGKAGLFEQSDGGTLFLDEIGDVSFKVQARLLRVLQENEIMRVGATEIRKVDVRVIAATHRDLGKMVSEKTFREDLYYRLKIGFIHVPPLRERKEDIAELLQFFVSSEASGSIEIDDEVIQALSGHHWHGNVRELKNSIAYMMAVRSGNRLTLQEIPNKSFFESSGQMNQNEVVSSSVLTVEELFVLEKIKEIVTQKQICGRDKISLLSQSSPYPMTPSQIRHKLKQLELSGYVTSEKGKVGTRLSDKGEHVLMAMNNH